MIDKWNSLKSFVEGMSATSTGQTQKIINKVLVRMDSLEDEETAERERYLAQTPTVNK